MGADDSGGVLGGVSRCALQVSCIINNGLSVPYLYFHLSEHVGISATTEQ